MSNYEINALIVLAILGAICGLFKLDERRSRAARKRKAAAERLDAIEKLLVEGFIDSCIKKGEDPIEGLKAKYGTSWWMGDPAKSDWDKESLKSFSGVTGNLPWIVFTYRRPFGTSHEKD